MTTKPQTREELDNYAAQLKRQAESGQLSGAGLDAKIAELREWANGFHEHAEELRRYHRPYPRSVEKGARRLSPTAPLAEK